MKRNLLFYFLLFVLNLVLGLNKVNAQAITIYISGNGDDNRTLAQAQNSATPWKTLDRLNQFITSKMGEADTYNNCVLSFGMGGPFAVRTNNSISTASSQKNLISGDQVLFERGFTYRGSCLIYARGTANAPVTFGAYGTGADPIFSGSDVLTSAATIAANQSVAGGSNTAVGNWSDVSLNSVTVARIQVNKAVEHLYYNGQLMTLARYPEAGTLGGLADPNQPRFLRNAHPTASKRQYDGLSTCVTQVWNEAYSSDATFVTRSNSNGLVNGNIVARLNNSYWDVMPITSSSNGTIGFSNFAGAGVECGFEFDWGFYVDNDIDLLNTRGEWFYDGTYVYFYPPSGVTSATLNANTSVEATVRNFTFYIPPAILNNNNLSAQLWTNDYYENIVFKNMELKHNTRKAFWFDKTNNIVTAPNSVVGYVRVEDCYIHDIGAQKNITGVPNNGGILSYQENTQALRVNVKNCLGGGIIMSGNNKPNKSVTLCTVDGIGMAPGYCSKYDFSGIICGGFNSTITGCVATNCGGSGVAIEVNSDNSVITKNLVTGTCKYQSDWAAITMGLGCDNLNISNNFALYSKSFLNNAAYHSKMVEENLWDHGLYFSGKETNGTQDNHTMSKNTAAFNSSNGILALDGPFNSTINNNWLFGNEGSGFQYSRTFSTTCGSVFCVTNRNTFTNNVLYNILDAPNQYPLYLANKDTKTDKFFDSFSGNYLCNPYSNLMVRRQFFPSSGQFDSLYTYQAFMNRSNYATKAVANKPDCQKFTGYRNVTLGSELITNGNFTTNANGWSIQNPFGSSGSFGWNSGGLNLSYKISSDASSGDAGFKTTSTFNMSPNSLYLLTYVIVVDLSTSLQDGFRQYDILLSDNTGNPGKYADTQLQRQRGITNRGIYSNSYTLPNWGYYRDSVYINTSNAEAGWSASNNQLYFRITPKYEGQFWIDSVSLKQATSYIIESKLQKNRLLMNPSDNVLNYTFPMDSAFQDLDCNCLSSITVPAWESRIFTYNKQITRAPIFDVTSNQTITPEVDIEVPNSECVNAGWVFGRRGITNGTPGNRYLVGNPPAGLSGSNGRLLFGVRPNSGSGTGSVNGNRGPLNVVTGSVTLVKTTAVRNWFPAGPTPIEKANYLDRNWQIDITGVANNSSSGTRVRLFFTDDELRRLNNADGAPYSTTNSTAALKVYKFPSTGALTQAADSSSGVTWVEYDVREQAADAGSSNQPGYANGATVNTFNTTVKGWYAEFDVTSFSRFYIGRRLPRVIVLPITMLAFDAKKSVENSNDVVVTWSIGEEKGFSHYELEKSFDGQTFRKIADISPKISSSSRKEYDYLDKDASELKNGKYVYYRLNSVDKDGKSELSEVRAVEMNAIIEQVALMPVPASQTVYVSYTSPNEANLEIEITAITGALVQKIEKTSSVGQNKHSIDISTLSPGVYFVSISNGVNKVMKKLVVE